MRCLASVWFACVGLAGLACTMPNPEFDSIAGSGSEADDQTEVSSEAEAEAEAEESSDVGEDLPDANACEFAVSDGLALKFGDPNYFGNNCPNAIQPVYARIDAAEGGEATLSFCEPGCTDCVGAHPLSTFPMSITDYIPAPSDKCVIIETTTPFGHDDHACFWGAITILDGTTQEPHFIGVAHSTPPTPLGYEFAAQRVPTPLKGGSCNCDAVGQSNECCYSAPNAPEFWYYAFGDTIVYPAGYVAFDETNSAGLVYYFKLEQAQRVYGCENPDLQLSWAITPR